MDSFGGVWVDHANRLQENWHLLVGQDDLVFLPGDISWGNKLERALLDLEWIDQLPGTKVMIRGNHDYWWPSLKKLRELPFASIHYIHNNALRFGEVAVGGARLFDYHTFNFDAFMESVPQVKEVDAEEVERLYQRELVRLETSLQQIDVTAPFKVALTHYPPLGVDMAPTPATDLLEKYHINLCLFGHLHGMKQGVLPFGVARGVRYVLTSFDYLGGTPLEIAQTPN